VLDNCAREPEIIDLAELLNKMGAQIEGAGEERIEIQGVAQLTGASHSIIADRIEAGTYPIGAAMTGGDVRIENARPRDLAALLEKLTEAGCQIDIDGPGVRLKGGSELAPKDVVTAPHPGFPTDLQAQYMALMTQAHGNATVCETVFENRFQHVPELNRMGANIEIDGSYARIHGPSELSAARVMATDLRASASLVLAGLVAEGTTLVDRIYHLDRGYESMESKLQALGARVERVSGV
jgi:UDP-N-acetylglucosamine 1-carboxyvinyltransferase